MMSNVLQSIGCILTVFIVVVGYVTAFLRYKAKKKYENAEQWLLADLLMFSMIGIIILIIFCAISLII